MTTTQITPYQLLSILNCSQLLFSTVVSDSSLITKRGLQNGKITSLKLVAPTPSRQEEIFQAPTLKGWKLFAPPPPPPSLWLKLVLKLCPALKLLQNLLCPPCLKPFLPLLFVGVKLDSPPPVLWLPILPIINDWSLKIERRNAELCVGIDVS